MSLHVLAYNLRRVINIMGAKPLMAAIRSPRTTSGDVRSRIAATTNEKEEKRPAETALPASQLV
jgi:hypothetical protein